MVYVHILISLNIGLLHVLLPDNGEKFVFQSFMGVVHYVGRVRYKILFD